jgi:hypothetical protein
VKHWLAAPLLALIAALGGFTTLWAIDVSTSLYTSNIQLLNLGLTRQNFAAATEISGASLIDDAFMAADTLNAVITQGPTEIPSMPPNNRINVQDCVTDDGGSFVDWQSECQTSTEADFPLLPAAPAVDDAIYFACDNPCRIITVNVAQEAVADSLSVLWEYFNGTAFVTASNVSDLTQSFTRAGQRAISFDMPSDFATTSVTGSVVGATYWVRARVSEVDSPAQQALGTEAWYENGQWWQWGQSQSINQELLYQLNVGGPDLVTNHQIMPGAAGVVTPDNASIELGDTYTVHFDGSINFTAGVTGSDVCIVCKDAAFRLYISESEITGSTNEITLDLNSGAVVLSIDGIPDSVDLPISTTPHIVDVISDGTDVTLSVDGVGTATDSAVTINDNANDWTFGSNQGFVFANTIYFLPDDTAVAFEMFDSESDWDTGNFVNTQSTSGEPDAEISTMVEIAVDDGFWRTGASPGFFNALSIARFGNIAGDPENSFFRFDNVQIPAGSTISATHLEFVPQQLASSITVDTLIAGIDDADANAPSNSAEAIAAVRTTAQVAWNNVETWSHASHVTPTTNDSPDIASIIQEIVDLPGWVSGNSIVIFVEDNGSSSNATRSASTVEEHHSAAKLKITLAPAPAAMNDFVELETNLTVPLQWARDCGTCNGSWLVDSTGARFGNFGTRPNPGPSGNSFDGITQNLAASAGEVWSASVRFAEEFSSDNGEFRLYMRWLDSGGSTISEVFANNSAVGSPLYSTMTLNGQTAPANTAFLQIRLMEESCGVSGCDGNAFPNLWDAAMACICATAPTFPDALNQLTNESFEQIYDSTGTWVSPTINLTQTDVATSLISWDSIEPTGTTLLIEVSLDNQMTWQTATNNDPIPGITPGDDLSGQTLHVRLSFTPDSDGGKSASVGLLSLIILDDVPETSALLFYQLRETPGIIIDDLSPNVNNGVMSYPVQLSGIVSNISPLRSNRTLLSQQDALGIGDFAAPVTGSGANLNLFGEDKGEYLPFVGAFVQAFESVGFPVNALWAGAILIITVGAGAVTWRFTNSNELIVSIVVGGILILAAAIGDGLIPGWVPFVTILMLVSYNLLRSRLPI